MNYRLQRDDANARFYGSNVTVSDILHGKSGTPRAALPLMQTLYAAEGRPEILGTEAIPEGGAPGDVELSPEEKKELESYQQEQQQQQQQQQGGQGVVDAAQSPFGDQAAVNSSGKTSHRVPPPPPPSYDASTASSSAGYPIEKS
jgi:transcription initiation factor TFIID subunit TAF12